MSRFNYEYFRVRANLGVYKKRLFKSSEIIKKALSMDKSWYVSCSGGKDSVALAHLVSRLSPNIEIFSQKDDCDFPGEKEYLEDLASKFNWNLRIVEPDFSLFARIREFSDNICEDIHSRGKQLSDEAFYSLIRKQEERYDGVFLGLRAEESNAREKNFLKRGYIYKRKNGKMVCIPLAAWKGDDVFTYLVSNDIPIFDIYLKTSLHSDPTKIRKAWFLPGACARQGQVVWLQHYYPDIYFELKEVCPEVSNYV